MVVVSEFLDVGWYVPGRTGLLTRLISFLIKWRLYPRSFQKVYSFIAALIEEIVSGADGRRRKARLKGMVRFVWAGWQKVFRRYWCLSDGFVWRSVSIWLLLRST